MEDRAASGSTSLSLGDRTEAWDAGAAKKALDPSDYGKAFFWRDPQGDPKTLAAYKLPFASPSGGLHAVWKGVTAAAAVMQGGRGGANIPDADVAGVKAKIAAYYTKASKKYDDNAISVPWASGSSRADVPSLSCLMEMYQAGVEFIAGENDPEDGPDRDAMAAILEQIEKLIEVEANEDVAAYARALVAEGRGERLVYAVAPITHVDVRQNTYDGETWTMSGYAAVFDQPTTLYDGKFLRLTESIAPVAFNKVLRDQPMADADGVVHLNFGHDLNRAVAATNVPPGQPGSLQLSADKFGLQFLARVARDDPDGVAMASKMRTGVLRQASFAFTVNTADYELTETADGPDVEHRTITEIGKLFDVCATAQGAYPQTVSQLRSYAAAIGQPTDEPEVQWDRAVHVGGQPHQPNGGGASAVSPDAGGDAEETAEEQAEREAEQRERERNERLEKLATRTARLLSDLKPRAYT